MRRQRPHTALPLSIPYLSVSPSLLTHVVRCDAPPACCPALALSHPQAGLEVEDVYFAAVKHGLTMSQGPNFYWETDPNKAKDKHMRLAFTSSSQEQLAEAMRRLGVACKEVAAEMGASVEVLTERAAL